MIIIFSFWYHQSESTYHQSLLSLHLSFSSKLIIPFLHAYLFYSTMPYLPFKISNCRKRLKAELMGFTSGITIPWSPPSPVREPSPIPDQDNIHDDLNFNPSNPDIPSRRGPQRWAVEKIVAERQLASKAKEYQVK